MVEGHVKRPGAYDIPANGISLLDALQAAGLDSDDPDLTIQIIRHRTIFKKINFADIDQEPNIVLEPDDMVLVLKPKPATQPATTPAP